MKICILADPIDEQYAGVHFYTNNLVENLLEIDDKNEYLLIHCRKNPIFKKWINKRKAPTKEILIKNYRFIPGWPTLRKFFLLSFAFRKYKPDLILEPAHIGPFSLFWKCKKVVTIHDITPIIFPEHHVWASRFIHKYFLPLILKNANGIITPSKATKDDLIKHYNPKAPIQITHEAAAKNFKPSDKNQTQAIKRKYNITKPYILTVGTIEPRKNLNILIEAFQQLKKEGFSHQIVLSGKKGWFYQELMKKIENPETQKDIIVTGYLPDQDLPALYSGAEIFVYPSLYEGFGLPPLEAMQCGCPVICSNTSSLPEVVGNAGITFHPTNITELKHVLYKVLSDEKMRLEMSKKGLKQAQNFSWDKCAKQTLDFFKQLQ